MFYVVKPNISLFSFVSKQQNFVCNCRDTGCEFCAESEGLSDTKQARQHSRHLKVLSCKPQISELYRSDLDISKRTSKEASNIDITNV